MSNALQPHAITWHSMQSCVRPHSPNTIFSLAASLTSAARGSVGLSSLPPLALLLLLLPAAVAANCTCLSAAEYRWRSA